MTNRAITKSPGAKTLSAIERDVLIALFRLSRDTQHISAKTLAAEVSSTPTQTGAALVRLEDLGVVDATRARLTMKGLVLAAQLGAGSGGPRMSHTKPQHKAAPVEESLPVAALPSQPPRAPAAQPNDYEQPSYYEQPSIGLLS